MNGKENYRVNPGVHVRGALTTGAIMYDVLLALLPAAVAAIGRFGTRALLLLAAAVFSAVTMEFAFNCLTGRKGTLRDGSAAVTGLLLGLSLPPDVPVIVPYAGAAFAVVIVKGLFGGLGHNRLNPAMAGRCLLTVAFGGAMTGWWKAAGAGALTGSGAELARLLLGTDSPILGGSVIALLLGGLWLLRAGHVSWYAPVCTVLSYMALTLAVEGAAGIWQTALFLSGGGMLAACFMAVDPVTGPVTGRGRAIFGVLIGAVSFLLRRVLAPAEAACLAVLLADLAAPGLDRLVLR